MPNDALPPQSPGEFIMAGQGIPVSEATMQFFIEAMRANTSVLENVGKSLLVQQDELKEQLRLITDVRERVIRIEAAPLVDKELETLKRKVEALEKSNIRDGAKAETWTWIVRYVPTLAGIVVTIIASVLIILVTSGQLTITPRQVPGTEQASAASSPERHPNDQQ